MYSKIKKFNPAVDKRLLIAISGITWCIIGIALCFVAINWISQAGFKYSMWLGVAGIILSLLIHHLGFLRLVNRNIDRILSKKGKVCLFAFQTWKSYLIVFIMVAMGVALRYSPLPKPYLSVSYIGFGGAMFLSSIRYFRILFKLIFIR